VTRIRDPNALHHRHARRTTRPPHSCLTDAGVEASPGEVMAPVERLEALVLPPPLPPPLSPPWQAASAPAPAAVVVVVVVAVHAWLSARQGRYQVLEPAPPPGDHRSGSNNLCECKGLQGVW